MLHYPAKAGPSLLYNIYDGDDNQVKFIVAISCQIWAQLAEKARALSGFKPDVVS